MTSATIVSIQIGQPQPQHDPTARNPQKRNWMSSIYRTPVSTPVRLDRLHLDGDQEADHKHHGGVDKAVNVYPVEHYAGWLAELGLEMSDGAFGENFTTAGLLESDVCIGDQFEVGEALVELSQPRGPCWKLNRRWGVPDLAARADATGRTGWYFRVLRPGMLQAGQKLCLVERPYPQWSVARVNLALQNRAADRATALELAAVPLLAQVWRDAFSDPES